MKKRIYGLETEYGLLIKDDEFELNAYEAAERIKDRIFDKKLGVLDQHYRANDEPPGNGGFLANGGRVYLDMGNLEYASPECANLVDLITYDRAGDLMIQETVEELGWADQIAIIKNNVDLESNVTFGCHENYLVSRSFQFENRDNLKILASFLVTRQIFCGAGRVGSCSPRLFRDWETEPQDPAGSEVVDFQLSQRADHIPNEFYRWVQYNRAIVNTRDEPLSDPSKYRRIHLLVGDSNICEFSTALKMGTTSLLLELIELGVVDTGWIIADTVSAMRSISRDPDRKWEIVLRNGNKSTALEHQWQIQRAAKKHLAGKNQETDWILTEWESVLTDIPRGPEFLLGRVDWASKLWMLGEFMREENLTWADHWIKSQDLEYHNLNKNQGLYWCLEENGEACRKTSDAAIIHAKTNSPKGTRADGRGELVKTLIGHTGCLIGQGSYLIDWIGFRLNKDEPFLMLDPFISYKNEIRAYLKQAEMADFLDLGNKL